MTQIDPNQLAQTQLGEDLDGGQLSELAACMGSIELDAGDVLVRAGEDDPRLFVLADGKLAVIAPRGGEEETVYVMKRGECAGTRAFVDRSPRQATLRAQDACRVYALSPEAFESLVEREPWLVYRVMCAIFRITHRNLLRMNAEAQELENYVMKVHGRY